MRTQRVLALVCLALSFPPCFFFLPWLPFTIQNHFRIINDLQYPGGTISYYADRQTQLHNNHFALILYSFGVFSLLGFVGIAFHRCNWLSQRIVWLAACAAGVGLDIFWCSGVTPDTAGAFSLLAIYLPLSVALLASFAFIMTFIHPHESLPPTHRSAQH